VQVTKSGKTGTVKKVVKAGAFLGFAALVAHSLNSGKGGGNNT
jgi:hypothetical protein